MADHLNEEILSTWVNGLISDKEKTEVEHHIHSCSTCKKTADEIQWLTRSFAALPKFSVDGDLVEQTILTWREDKENSMAYKKNFFQFRMAELSRPVVIALVTIGLIFGFWAGKMTKLVIDPYADSSLFFAKSLSDEGTDLSDPYMELLMADNGNDL